MPVMTEHTRLNTTKVLLIGESRSPHCRCLLESLSQCDVSSGRTIREVIEFERESQPDLIVIYQGVPDEYPHDEVQRLIATWPLTPCVVCFGPWCESIGRTEQVWPVGWCVSLKSSGERIRRELNRASVGFWPLPPTASRDEAFGQQTTDSLEQLASLPALRVHIAGDDRHLAAFAADLLSAVGLAVNAPGDPDVLLILATVPDSARCDETRQRIARYAPEPVVIVASDLSTERDAQQWHEACSARMISQVRLMDDLTGELVHLRMNTQRQSGAA